jgi:hypothetical protein
MTNKTEKTPMTLAEAKEIVKCLRGDSDLDGLEAAALNTALGYLQGHADGFKEGILAAAEVCYRFGIGPWGVCRNDERASIAAEVLGAEIRSLQPPPPLGDPKNG